MTNLATAQPWVELSEDEFYGTFDTVPAPDGSELWQRDEISNIPVNRLWSVYDAEDGGVGATAGLHWVNIFAYMVTTTPWPSQNINVTLDEGDPEYTEEVGD